MIVDLFAGAGGWDVGARMAGLPDPLGIEYDAAACETRRTNGLPTLEADVTDLDPADYAGADGLIASPPCQDFSSAGRRSTDTRGLEGKRGSLMAVVPEWVDELRPRWVACEQVVDVVDVWRLHALTYEQFGYRTWVGMVNAADYGVPQTRKRAVLLANLERPVAPPSPTHASPGLVGGMFDTSEPWVTGACAVDLPDGFHLYDRRQQNPDGTPVPPVDLHKHPAPTVTAAGAGGTSVLRNAEGDTSPIPTAAFAAWQSFPLDFEFVGSRTDQGRQIGNAVPPLLAARLLEAVAS